MAAAQDAHDNKIMNISNFEEYVLSLPEKRKKYDGTWKATQVNPCPLMYRCSSCKSYLPAVDFYKMNSIKSTSRHDALGNKLSPKCPQCHMNAYFDSDPRRKLLYSARGRAREKGLEFSLVVEDIIIPEYCPVLGIKLRASIGTGRLPIDKLWHSPTVDRLNNEQGYTPTNIRVISHRANSLKNNATLEEMKQIVAYMERELEMKYHIELTLDSAHTSMALEVLL